MRVIAWFSCGAASAVAAKLAVQKYGDDCRVVYCDTLKAEHPDNARFMADVAQWIGREIEIIRSVKYASIDEVFAARRYLAGVAGAPCTVEMKKVPRFAYQMPDDRHVFGFTLDEQDRIEGFERNNPELDLDWILRDREIGKKQCFRMLEAAKIRLPKMYELGFANNNCIGCVKASSPAYWARVRRHFPEVFALRAEQSNAYGARLVRIDGERRFLNELPLDDALPLFDGPEEDVSCGPQCGTEDRREEAAKR
jgi:hypothetical protein